MGARSKLRRNSNATARVTEFFILRVDEQAVTSLFDNLTEGSNCSKYQRVVAKRRLRFFEFTIDFSHEENLSTFREAFEFTAFSRKKSFPFTMCCSKMFENVCFVKNEFRD